MASDQRPRVLLVPGGVMPVAVSYGPLIEILRDDTELLTKDLELYAGDRPPAGFGLDTEVEGIRRTADEAGWDRFNLVGYSGGGAASLAFAACYPDRLRTLALVEPAWTGNDDWTPEEKAYWAEMDRLMALPEPERLPAFIRNALRPDVEFSPPPGPPPPWMAKRPAGLEAFNQAFRAYNLDLERLRAFHQPAYLAVGSLSNVAEERKAEHLARYLPNLRIEVYEGLHHFNPPQRAAAERFATDLRELWRRG